MDFETVHAEFVDTLSRNVELDAPGSHGPGVAEGPMIAGSASTDLLLKYLPVVLQSIVELIQKLRSA